MRYQQAERVQVYYCGDKTQIPIGRLALKNRVIFFEYDPAFLATQLQLSPYQLPLKSGVIACEDTIFEGLFGVFNDSLPDGWGRLLLDRKLAEFGIHPADLTPLDRLCYVGTNGMGALRYEPEISDNIKLPAITDLDLIADESIQLQDQEDVSHLDELLRMNGSSAGARPKILVNIENNQHFTVSDNHQSTTQNHWIIKFRSSLDPKDAGPIEYAYHLMAQQAGLIVPAAQLFPSKKCTGYFGVKRFDRQENKCLHVHTISGLLQMDHRIPSLDYETLLKVTLWLTKDAREAEKQFRNAVFNILTHNRDDHAKNFTFLMDGQGNWKVSPAYDLTFSQGPAGEHCTTVIGAGKNITRAHLLKLASVANISVAKANEMINEVQTAVINWPRFADAAQVSSRSAKAIQTVLVSILRGWG